MPIFPAASMKPVDIILPRSQPEFLNVGIRGRSWEITASLSALLNRHRPLAYLFSMFNTFILVLETLHT